MPFLNFKQTHRFNWYTILWLGALILAGILYYQWHIDKQFIGIVEKHSHAMSAMEAGIVDEILVDVGEQVDKEQVLALLDISDLDENLTHLQKIYKQLEGVGQAQEDHSAMTVERLKLQTENETSALIDRLAQIESKATELDGYNREIDRLKEAEAAGLGYSSTLPALIIQRDALASYLQEQRFEADRLSERLQLLRQSRQKLEAMDDDSLIQGLIVNQMQYKEMVRQQILETKKRIRMRTLIAPVSGLVTEQFVRPGDVVQAFDSLLVVEEAQPRFLTVYIPETSTLEPVPGMRVKVFSSRSRRHQAEGVVRFVHPGYTQAHDRLTFRGINFWARKVRVELTATHTLLPGEVVTVRVRKGAMVSAEKPKGVPTS